jgi:enamine deaminase RidA (YjgF/YER057c/UK114 family)
MTDILRLVTNPRRGRAVVHNGVIYVGGQAASDRSQDIRGQTDEALTKLEAVLTQAGTDMSRLLSAQIWLKDIGRDFAGFNEIWDARIDADAAPARATAQCEMGAPDVLVEIIATAAMPE